MKSPLLMMRSATALILTSTLMVSTIPLTGCSSKNSPAENQAKAQEHIDRADSYLKQGQYRAAIIEIRNAIQKNPEDTAAKLKLASIFNELGQGKSALKLFEPLRNDPSREEALIVAQAYFQQNKFQSTLDYLTTHEQRLNLATDANANLLRVRAHLKLGNLDAAEALLTKLDVVNVDVAIEKLHLLQQRGQTDASQAELSRLLQEHPNDVSLLSEAAFQAESQGKLDDSQDFLSKALMNLPQTDIVAPQKIEILQRLISTLTKLGRSTEALVYAKTLSDSNPTGSLLQDKFKQGLELFQAGKLDEAETLLAEVYNETKNENTGMLLGMIRYAKRDFSGAQEYFGTNIDPETAPESALTTLAATQLSLSQPDKLLQVLGPEERKQIKSPELKLLVGIALQETGETIESEKLIKSALAEQPDNAALLTTLARHYLANREPNQAASILEPAIAKQNATNAPHLSRLLITAYIQTGNEEKALATARKQAATAPASAENWWVLGHTGLVVRNFDVAESALLKSLELQADFLPAKLDLGSLHLTRKQSAQAESIFRSILKQHPERMDAAKGLLAALVQRGLEPKAIDSELLTAAESNNARAVMAEYYLQTQKLDDARQQLAAMPKDNATPAARQLRLRLILTSAAQALQSQQFDKARDIIAEGLENTPNSPELLLFLARIDLQTKNIAGAKKIAAELAQAYPQHPQVLELLGDIATTESAPVAPQHYRAAWQQIPAEGIAIKLYQSLAQSPSEADKFIAEWNEKLPSSTTARFLRGVQKQQAGNKKGAMTDYEAVLALNSKDIRALNNLAWLYFEMGDKRALEIAERAYSLQPENPAVLDTYGWILVKSGQKRGVDILQKAFKLAPDSKEIEQHLMEATKRE